MNQVNKYSFTNLPDEVFTIIPDVNNNGDKKIGEFYIENHQLKCNVKELDLEKNLEYRITDNEWMDNYLKILLLGNVPFGDILNKIEQHRVFTKQNLLPKYQAHHLLDCFITMSNEDFYSFISKYI
ncbi:MAG: hypothetical protein NTY75_04155 [Candidatus Shapirobacteria bacterium]|nr:hypothetical protein [Candidatus Shapirobacteria bacterium]